MAPARPAVLALLLLTVLLPLAAQPAWGEDQSKRAETRVEGRYVTGSVTDGKGGARQAEAICIHIDAEPLRRKFVRCLFREGQDFFIAEYANPSIRKPPTLTISYIGSPFTPKLMNNLRDNIDSSFTILKEGSSSQSIKIEQSLSAEGMQSASKPGYDRLNSLNTSDREKEFKNEEPVLCDDFPCSTRNAFVERTVKHVSENPRPDQALAQNVGTPVQAPRVDEKTSVAPLQPGSPSEMDPDLSPAIPNLEVAAAGPGGSEISGPPSGKTDTQKDPPPAAITTTTPDTLLPFWLVAAQFALLLVTTVAGLANLWLTWRRPLPPPPAPYQHGGPSQAETNPVAVHRGAELLLATWLGRKPTDAAQVGQELAAADKLVRNMRDSLAKLLPDPAGQPPVERLPWLVQLAEGLIATLRRLGVEEPRDPKSLAAKAPQLIEQLWQEENERVKDLEDVRRQQAQQSQYLDAHARLLAVPGPQLKRLLAQPNGAFEQLAAARALRQAARQLKEVRAELVEGHGRADIDDALRLGRLAPHLVAWSERAEDELEPAAALTRAAAGGEGGWQMVNDLLRADLLAATYLPARPPTDGLRQALAQAAGALRHEFALAGLRLGQGRLLVPPEPGDKEGVAKNSPLLELPEAREVVARVLGSADAYRLVIDYRGFARSGAGQERAAEPLTLVLAAWQQRRGGEG